MEYNIRDVQLAQLDILKKFQKICEKHSLQYFAGWGTLLGAVRHSAFIPWDDDIDIMMPRHEFERFLIIAKQELHYPYFVQTNESDPEYHLQIARIHNLETTYIEENYEHLNIRHGILIDIYPVDGYSTSVLYQFYFNMMRKFYFLCITDWTDGSNNPRKRAKSVLSKIMRSIFFRKKDNQYIHEKIHALYTLIPFDQADTLIADFHDSLIFPKEIFRSQITIDFEDTKILAPKEYHKFLTQLYGDYMKLPPVEKRKPHHLVTKVDTINR